MWQYLICLLVAVHAQQSSDSIQTPYLHFLQNIHSLYQTIDKKPESLTKLFHDYQTLMTASGPYARKSNSNLKYQNQRGTWSHSYSSNPVFET